MSQTQSVWVMCNISFCIVIITRLKMSWKREFDCCKKCMCVETQGLWCWLTSLKHFMREDGISPSRTCRTASTSSLAAYPPRSLANRLKRSASRHTQTQKRFQKKCSALSLKRRRFLCSCREGRTGTRMSILSWWIRLSPHGNPTVRQERDGKVKIRTEANCEREKKH